MQQVNSDYIGAVRLFQPEPDEIYTIETAGHLAHTPPRLILTYYKHGLVSTVTNPAWDGYYFDSEAIRTLRRIEFLRTDCGVNLPGIKLILRLLNEVEHLSGAPPGH